MAKSAKREAVEPTVSDEFLRALSEQDGNLVIDASLLPPGTGIEIRENTDTQLRAPAVEQDNDRNLTESSVTKAAYNIGDKLDNGWIVGPVSPTTGHVMVIEPVESALEGYQTWYKGEEHAKELDARQPDENELNTLYNEVVKAGHNQHARLDAGADFSLVSHWSSSSHPNYSCFARIRYFFNGPSAWKHKDLRTALVRVVRDAPELTLA